MISQRSPLSLSIPVLPIRPPCVQVAVQAYSVALQGGGSARALAAPVAPPKQWTCVPVPGSYPLCSDALGGRCAPLTCQQQVGRRLGLAGGVFS